MVFVAVLGVIGLFFTLGIFLKKYYTRMIDKLRLELKYQFETASIESKKMEVITSNLQEALFTVGPGGKIVEPITAYAEKVFGRPILGDSVMDTLFKGLEENMESYDSVRNAFATAIGESELQWDLVESNIPRKIQYKAQFEDKIMEDTRLFNIFISPIWDGNQNLDRLLFVVQDVTHIEKREVEFKQNNEMTGMLECILENNPEDLGAASKNFREALQSARNLTAQIDPANFMEILRVLHTMKGSARQLKMRVLSEQIHKSESGIMAKMSDVFQTDDTAPITTELNHIETVIDAHLSLFKKILRSDSGMSEAIVPVNQFAFDSAEKSVELLKPELPPKSFAKVYAIFQRLRYKSVTSMAQKFSAMVSDISAELGKKVQFTIEGDALVSPEYVTPLHQCLIHILRNSIDHGIEAPEIRRANKKSESGQIVIKCADFFNSIVIQIADDGRGVDSATVVKNAVTKGLISQERAEALTEQERINLIFLPNLTTKDAVSAISGRGIGMDYVKETIDRLGGELVATSNPGQGLSISIKLHNKAVSENLVSKKAA